VNGTTHRFSTSSHRRQWEDAVLQIGYAWFRLPRLTFRIDEELSRRRHPLPCHDQPATFWLVADDRCRIVRVDTGKWRHVPGAIIHGARQFPDRLLALGDGVAIALVGEYFV
jgi:hypothetical protein